MPQTKRIIRIFAIIVPFYLQACSYLRIDPWHYMVRSDQIISPEMEKEILSRAKLEWSSDHRIRVIYLNGTPYERGYQQGVLLRQEIQDNLKYFYKRAVDKFYFPEFFDEAFERARPFIPQEYLDEMHGLAHGSRLPISMIHHIHILPEIGEWGGKKQIKNIIKQMMDGELATSCSNISVAQSATPDGKMYTVRILDWGLHKISKLHQYPLISVNKPDKGNSYVNIGWVGFIGAISGMNDKGITLGEMGYGNPEGETLRGKPMPFLLRDVMTYASNLTDVQRIISTSPGTNSFVFLMSDGKNGQAELYVRDRFRFLVFPRGQDVNSEDKREFPAIKDTVYGGHYSDKLNQSLTEKHGQITPELLMREIVPYVAMKSNFQNVIYEPASLQFWVSNAMSSKDRAAEQPYTFFDFKEALKKSP